LRKYKELFVRAFIDELQYSVIF